MNLKEKLISYIYVVHEIKFFFLPKFDKNAKKRINENANLFLQIENEDDEMTRSTTTTSRSLNIQDPVPAGGTSSFIFSEKIDDLTILYICLAGVLVLLSVLLVILIYV